MNTPRRPAATPPRRGLTLTETMVALTITLVAVGAAAPGFESARERRHLEGVAAQLETDLALARSEAVALNRTLRVVFERDASGSCYMLHTGSIDDCRCSATGPVCRAGVAAVRHVRVAADSGVGVVSNVRTMVFEPDKGTVTPTGTVRVEGRDGRALHQVVNLMGRVRTCSPAPALPGYKAC